MMRSGSARFVPVVREPWPSEARECLAEVLRIHPTATDFCLEGDLLTFTVADLSIVQHVCNRKHIPKPEAFVAVEP